MHRLHSTSIWTFSNPLLFYSNKFAIPHSTFRMRDMIGSPSKAKSKSEWDTTREATWLRNCPACRLSFILFDSCLWGQVRVATTYRFSYTLKWLNCEQVAGFHVSHKFKELMIVHCWDPFCSQYISVSNPHLLTWVLGPKIANYGLERNFLSFLRANFGKNT